MLLFIMIMLLKNIPCTNYVYDDYGSMHIHAYSDNDMDLQVLNNDIDLQVP